MSRDRIEGVKPLFGQEQSETSCSGLGSMKCSAAECGPTSSYALKKETNRKVKSSPSFLPKICQNLEIDRSS